MYSIHLNWVSWTCYCAVTPRFFMIDAHKAVLPEPKLPTTLIAKPGLIVFAISNPISLVSSILFER